VSLFVKVCGVRRLEDVKACLAAGVDAIGFNFWPGSKRYISPAKARALVRKLPKRVLAVGVFVMASPEAVARAVADSGVRAVQLHGGEDPTLFASCGAELIQVFRIRTRDSLPRLPLPPLASKVLLDSMVEGFGGEGVTFDWSLAREARCALDRPMILAGGLDPENVAEAVRQVAPFGVDVASGVEIEPGVKDPARIRAFVEAARAAQPEEPT
jgi:phosphoribosylanthranilate isomerase